MKKKVMNIRPQEVTVDGERSVQYKGSDGKFHGIAPDGGNTAQSYAVVNNPNAYELVFSGQYVGGGQKKASSEIWSDVGEKEGDVRSRVSP